MKRFRPLGDRVLVLPDKAPEKVGGLSRPKSEEQEPTQGIVVAAGPNAIYIPMRVDPHKGYSIESLAQNLDGVTIGDRVQFGQYTGHKAMHNGVEHKLLRFEELEGVIEDDEQTDSQR